MAPLPTPPLHALYVRAHRRAWAPDLDRPRSGPAMTTKENLAVDQAEWTVEVSLQRPPEVSLRHPPEVSLRQFRLWSQQRGRLEVSLQRLPPFLLVTPSSGVLGVSP